MDSRPIGSDELIYIQAGNISITVKGIPAVSPDGSEAEEASSFRVHCRDEVTALRVGGCKVDRKQRFFRVHRFSLNSMLMKLL